MSALPELPNVPSSSNVLVQVAVRWQQAEKLGARGPRVHAHPTVRRGAGDAVGGDAQAALREREQVGPWQGPPSASPRSVAFHSVVWPAVASAYATGSRRPPSPGQVVAAIPANPARLSPPAIWSRPPDHRLHHHRRQPPDRAPDRLVAAKFGARWNEPEFQALGIPLVRRSRGQIDSRKFSSLPGPSTSVDGRCRALSPMSRPLSSC